MINWLRSDDTYNTVGMHERFMHTYVLWWMVGVIIGLGNGLSPTQCQAITWISAYLLSNNPQEQSFNQNRIIMFKSSCKQTNKQKLKIVLLNVGHFVLASMCQKETAYSVSLIMLMFQFGYFDS